ncbi:IclR family transcriptional regulator [Mumia sp. Pv 4-285]|uniref:IclR family transcriptional regulator n=1 Tax=Mumia qirimensis TaxID=3234852 RepID=UPI00351D739C
MSTDRAGGKPVQGEPVVDRAFALLHAFSDAEPVLSAADLSRASGVPLSTTYRLVARLVAWGALERRPDGRYTVGLGLLEIASLAPRGHGLREIAMPYLGDLADATRQHVLLAVREDDEAVLVERLSFRDAEPIHYRVGGRMPLHSTGVGLVLLAHADVETQERLLHRRLTRQPEGEPVDVTALRSTLAEVRRDGVAELHRGSPRPVLAVAGPVWDGRDRCTAALSVVVSDGSVSARHLVPAVRAACRAISRALGAPRAEGRPDTTTTDPVDST